MGRSDSVGDLALCCRRSANLCCFPLAAPCLASLRATLQVEKGSAVIGMATHNQSVKKTSLKALLHPLAATILLEWWQGLPERLTERQEAFYWLNEAIVEVSFLRTCPEGFGESVEGGASFLASNPKAVSCFGSISLSWSGTALPKGYWFGLARRVFSRGFAAPESNLEVGRMKVLRDFLFIVAVLLPI